MVKAIFKELKDLMPLFTCVIAVGAFLALGFFMFNLALEPIRSQVDNHIPSQIQALRDDIEDDIKDLEVKIDKILENQKEASK